MDRPASVSLHKRAASKHIEATPTAVSLFVRNVRLLNLNLLDDWPAVSSTTLGNHDARTRIRHVEWCLYQLFRLYDPATTADKLQPFFPPLEPLQSVNLRAALFRCLNEVKKNGILGREAVLRKSMLDDCQGEKLWELCLAFSTIVLRKVATDQQYGYEKPVAERLGNAQSLSRSQRESMLPLSIAHRAALAKILSDKEHKRRSFAAMSDIFARKQTELKQRRLEAKEWMRSGQVQSQVEQGKVAEAVLEKQWIGSDKLRDVIINGGEAMTGDSLLTGSFEDALRMTRRGPATLATAAEPDLLEDLESRIEVQSQRLQNWQSLHEKLLNSKPSYKRISTGLPKKSQLCFDKHQELTVHDMEYRAPVSPARLEKITSISKYDEILTSMRDELRKKSGPRQSSAPGPITQPKRAPVRAYSVSNDATTGARAAHSRQPSQTAVPVRPAMNRRVSSRSRSYHQPKVISQREPIPLKSEIFSPLKRSNTGSASPVSASSLISTAEEGPLNGDMEDVAAATAERSRSSSVQLQHADGILSRLGVRSSSRLSFQSNSSSPRTGRSGEHPDSAVEIPSKPVSLATKSIDSLGRTMRPSLADRTRMSMAFKSSDDIDTVSQEAGASPCKANDSDTPDSSDPEPTLTRQVSLLDRTRQSISLAPQTAPPKAKKTLHSRSRTSIYPANQSDTPQKVRRSTVNAADQPSAAKRLFTPQEKLFEEDAEYASVFKPRPKVALSPVMSPYDGDETLLMDGHANLDDLSNSSPLAGIRVGNEG